MLPIFLKDLRDRRISLLIYTVVMVLFILLYASLFPSIRDQSDSYQKLFETMPKAFMEAFGITASSFKSLESYLSIELFTLIWPLFAILIAISRAGAAIAGEVERTTLRTLLSLPISRTRLYLAKYLGGLVATAVFTIFTIYSVIPIGHLFDATVSIGTITHLAVICLLFTAAVFSTAMMFSAIFSDRGRVYMVTGGILVLSYVANIISGLKDSLEWLKHYSVFHYFNAADVLSKNASTANANYLFAAVIALTLAIGLVWFRRRDISASA